MNRKRTRRTVTVDETAEILGISRNLVYQGVRGGQIPSLRVGGRYLVPLPALQKLLTEGTAGPRR
jgi:excisionase family DNA binding protein